MDRFWMKSWRTAKVAALLLALAGPALAAPQVTVTDPAGVNQQTVNSSGQALVSPNVALTTTVQGLTVTTGGTFQSVLAASATRNGCLVQNPVAATETLFVYFGANGGATTAKSIALAAGSAVSCQVGASGVATDNISVTATTTGHAFIVYNQ